MIEYSQDAPFDALERIREKQPLNHGYELSKDDLTKLSELNSRLVGIEKILVEEVREAISYAEHRISNSKSTINDFEIEMFVYFTLAENDPDYDEDDDNCMMTLYQGLSKDGDLYSLADGKNHSDFTLWQHHPMFSEEHCWLFHGLYDHSQLSFEEILRVGEVNFSVKVELQWD